MKINVRDEAFESQSPRLIHQETVAPDRIQRRKEAYNAARELSGTWEQERGVVTWFDGHGEEEVEL